MLNLTGLEKPIENKDTTLCEDSLSLDDAYTIKQMAVKIRQLEQSLKDKTKTLDDYSSEIKLYVRESEKCNNQLDLCKKNEKDLKEEISIYIKGTKDDKKKITFWKGGTIAGFSISFTLGSIIILQHFINK